MCLCTMYKCPRLSSHLWLWVKVSGKLDQHFWWIELILANSCTDEKLKARICIFKGFSSAQWKASCLKLPRDFRSNSQITGVTMLYTEMQTMLSCWCSLLQKHTAAQGVYSDDRWCPDLNISESKVSLSVLFPRDPVTLVWTNPAGMKWAAVCRREQKRGCHHSHLQAFIFFKNLFGDCHKFPPKVLKLLFTFIYFKDRRVFYPLVDSIKVSSSQDRARLKVSIWNSVWVTCVGGRDWTSWVTTIIRWLPGWALVWNWVWKQIQDLSSGISVLCTGFPRDILATVSNSQPSALILKVQAILTLLSKVKNIHLPHS